MNPPNSFQAFQSLAPMLHFNFLITGAKERMTSPPPPSHSKVRVIKTPIPSSGSTPMPQSLSSITESGTEGDAAEDSETFNNLVGFY